MTKDTVTTPHDTPAEIALLPRDLLTDPEEQQAILEILTECDGDFCPPLSYRGGTSEKQLGHAHPNTDGVQRYYEEILQQSAILAKRGEEIIGFLSYRPSYRCPALEQFGEVCYMTTLCLRHSERGKGLSPAIYEAAEQRIRQRFSGRIITFRTWSTNQAQMHLTEKLGYRCVAVLKDDRGQGIDTMYFVKP